MKMRYVAVLTSCLVALGVAQSAYAATKVVKIMTTETNPDTKAALEHVISQYESSHPDVHIQPQYVGFQDLNTKLMASFAAGDPPQIFNVQSNYQAFVLAQKGLLRPVDDVIDSIGRDDYVQSVLDALTYDAKVWVVPFSIGVNVVWYRSDLYKKYGLKKADTWKEFLHNTKVLNEKGEENGKRKFYGIAMCAGENWLANDNTQNWMWSNGATIVDSDGNVTLADKPAVETFNYLKSLSQYAPPGISSYTNYEMLNAFATGAVAQTEYPFRMLAYLKKTNPSLLDVTVPMLHPKGPGDNAHHATFLYAKGWAMSKTAKNQDAAADFLKFLETGKREISMLKTVPVHYWPPRKSVANNPEFLDQPLLKTPAGKKSIKVLKEALKTGGFPLNASGKTYVGLGPVLADRVLAKALQNVLYNGKDAKEALGAAAQSIDVK